MPGCSTVRYGFHLTKKVVYPTAYDKRFTFMYLVPSGDEKILTKCAYKQQNTEWN